MTIDLESEHRYYHRLLELARNSRGEALLVPIETGQKHAVVRIFVNRNGKHILLSEIPVNLEDCKSAEPGISVSGEISGRKLILTVSVEGKEIQVEPISVGRYLKRNFKLPLLITAAVILAALLTFSLLKLLPALWNPATSPTLTENTGEVTQIEESRPATRKTPAPEVKNTKETVSLIQESKELADESGKALQEILNIIDKTVSDVRNIAVAIEEHSTANEEVARTTEQISEIATTTLNLMDKANNAIDDLYNLTQRLSQIIISMKKG